MSPLLCITTNKKIADFSATCEFRFIWHAQQDETKLLYVNEACKKSPLTRSQSSSDICKMT